MSSSTQPVLTPLPPRPCCAPLMRKAVLQYREREGTHDIGFCSWMGLMASFLQDVGVSVWQAREGGSQCCAI